MKNNRKFSVLLLLLMFPMALLAQKTVSGKVFDQSGEPLPGAAVVEKGTKNGTSTDFDGNYSLSVKDGKSVLQFSYMGYDTKEVVVGNKSKINVKLKEKGESLKEVIVVGYGTSTKKDLTGSIASIKPTKDAAEQAKSIQELIKGRSAGVQVIASGGGPGAAMSVKIRGASSLTTNTEPLYVVDGIIMDSAAEEVDDALSTFSQSQSGGIAGINPEDIASIEILKDASATAIYGSRAANGVIIITTKKGKKGKTKFNFKSSFSFGRVARNIDVLDTEDYVKYQNDVDVAQGFQPSYVINPDGTIYTTDTPPKKVEGINWAEDTYKTAAIFKNRLAISGGTDKSSYYLSGGMSKSEGVIPRAYANKFDFNLKINKKLNKKLKLSTKLSTSYMDLSSAKGPDAFGSANHSMIRQIILAAPILGFNEDSGVDDVDENIDGPRAWVAGFDDLSDDIRILGSLTADYKLTKALTYQFRFGADYRTKERSQWYGPELLKGRPSGLAGLSTLSRFRYNVDNLLTYRKRINDKHRINVMGGFLIDKKGIEKSTFSAAGFADLSLRADGISYGSSFTPLRINSEYPTILSFISRVNYTLLDRYLFTATFRADGSSKFPKGNQWGYFPSFSFAWKVINEPFFEDQKTFSDLKFRLGYGEVGNQNIPPYSFLTPFGSPGSGISDAAGGNLVAIVPLKLANPNLMWETSIQYNAGLDFGLFENRLTGTIDVYQKKSANLLLKVALPPSAGFNHIIANQGNIENKGIEFSLDANVLKNKQFKWNLFGNISFNRNKITDLGEIMPKEIGALGEVTAFFGTQISGGTYFKQPANIFIEGEELGLFYGYETDGLITSNDQLPLSYNGTPLGIGDVYFVDQNGDRDITDADKTIIGNPNPDFVYGFGTSFEYKNLSLSMMFNGVYGNDVANGTIIEIAYPNSNPKNILASAYYDAYDPVDNPDGNYPYVAFDKNVDYSRHFNDRIVEDGSFLRLNYVSLTYSVPMKNIKLIDKLDLTVSGNNLWLLTNYSGYDPEVNSFSFDPTRIGVDWASFPRRKTFSFSVNAAF